jgi:hypothetical protein
VRFPSVFARKRRISREDAKTAKKISGEVYPAKVHWYEAHSEFVMRDAGR